ncbi:MAG: enolase C-terminal domain-like protein [Acidobacteriota bacterium]
MTATRLDANRRELLGREAPLDRLELLELAVPQLRPFKSAIGERHERRALIVRWLATDGSWGVGECSCRPDPFFSGEFVDGAIAVIRDFIRPLLGGPRLTLGTLVLALGRIRGWPFTAASLLEAALDRERRLGRADALELLAPPGEPLERVPVGISLGLYDAPEGALRAVEDAAAQGYRRVKMKVSPAMNVETVREVRRAFPDLHLALDANGSCGPGDEAFLDSLADLDPEALEQPFAPEDLDRCADLRARIPGLRITLDESLTGFGALRSAERLGALDEVNLKPGRVGGQLETCAILRYCSKIGRAAWVGGMFETGIGRHANLRVAARLPAAAAHDLSPSSRYFSRDVVAHPLEMAADGTIDMSDDSPVELDEAALADMTVRRFELRGLR